MQKNPYENVIAVTNRSLCQRPFAEQIERVCSLHPKAVILREKDLPEEEYSRLAEQILKIKKRLNKILAGNTGKSVETIEADCERDHFMTAEEAKEYGLIDQVIYKR